MTLVLHRYGTGNKELVTYTGKKTNYHMNNVKHRETMMEEIRLICFETKLQGYSNDFVIKKLPFYQSSAVLFDQYNIFSNYKNETE